MRRTIKRGVAVLALGLFIQTLLGAATSPAPDSFSTVLTTQQYELYNTGVSSQSDTSMRASNGCVQAETVRQALTLRVDSGQQETPPEAFAQSEAAFGGEITSYCSYTGPNVSSVVIVAEYPDALPRMRDLKQTDRVCEISCDNLAAEHPNSVDDSFAMFYEMNGWWAHDVTYDSYGNKPYGMTFMARYHPANSDSICTVYTGTPNVIATGGTDVVYRGMHGIAEYACSAATYPSDTTPLYISDDD